MTIGTHDLDLIKREVASIREYYQSRMDAEIPPLKEEVASVNCMGITCHGALVEDRSGAEAGRLPVGQVVFPK